MNEWETMERHNKIHANHEASLRRYSKIKPKFDEISTHHYALLAEIQVLENILANDKKSTLGDNIKVYEKANAMLHKKELSNEEKNKYTMIVESYEQAIERMKEIKQFLKQKREHLYHVDLAFDKIKTHLKAETHTMETTEFAFQSESDFFDPPLDFGLAIEEQFAIPYNYADQVWDYNSNASSDNQFYHIEPYHTEEKDDQHEDSEDKMGYTILTFEELFDIHLGESEQMMDIIEFPHRQS